MSARTQVICIIRNRELAENVKALLEQDGYDVTVAKDSGEAVALLHQMHAGYVITSEDMESINKTFGLEPLYRANVPFVILHKASGTKGPTGSGGAWEDITHYLSGHKI